MRIDCRMSLLAALLGLGSAGLRAASAADPPVVLLWPDGAPGAAGSDDADRPSLTVYRPAPERASGLGVVVCPGGAYVMLAADHEGRQVAEWLNSEGHAAFLLR